MAYNKHVVLAVQRDFEAKRRASEAKRAMRLEEVYALCPKIREIDEELRKVSFEIVGAISLGKEECALKIEQIKERNLALQKKRAELLVSLGLDASYTELEYECELCKDTGYVSGFLCKCYKEALSLKGYAHSGLAKLLEKQSFESFSFDYYKGEDRRVIEQNFDELLSFAKNFETDKRSFLLYGPTGLGKTHLSSAVARYLLDNGYDVVYESAQNVFADFERDRFRDRFDDEVELVSDKYLDCDLLILDDLGTEMVTQFSVSCLYNIINTRLNCGLPIIASTNLRSDEIRKIYHDRITSRLFGEFTIQQFSGQDIRRQKIIR